MLKCGGIFIKIAQSNLGRGCVAIPGGRPIQPPRTIVQLYLPAGADVYAYLPYGFMGPSNPLSQTASRSSQPFFHNARSLQVD